MPRAIRSLALKAFGSACLVAAPVAFPVEARISVVVVTVDTLRPDALGWVAERNPTPAIDRLAREGVAFPAALSPVPLTLPAHVSLFSGRVPLHHGVHDNGQTVPGDLPLLAARFREAGYATAAFVSGFPLQRVFGLERGFAHYDDSLPEGAEGWLERRASATTAAALEWLARAPSPFFLWVHYYDPHDPYDPPRAFWRAGPRGAYDGEVAFVDHALGKLMDGLARRGERDLLGVLTADHGEALGEHGENTHGYFLYDSTVRVPLVFHWPGRLAARRSARPARLIDVAPTLLDLVGLAPLAGADGVSLAALLRGQDQAVPPAYLETRLPWTYFGWAPLRAWREPEWKLVAAPRRELYRLDRDPDENQPLDPANHEQAGRLEASLKAFERSAAKAAERRVDEDVLERLRALGYVGAGDDSPPPPEGLADPKDRLALRDRLMQAEAALRQGRAEEALRGFEEALREEPGNRMAALRAGVTLLRLGRLGAAVERLRRAVRLDPERAEARFALADALMRSGDPAAAVEHWLELARLQPARFEAWFNCGNALLLVERPEAAARALREALALRPQDARVRVGLARAELAAGRSGEALAQLLAVAPRSPSHFDGAGTLGLALARRGRHREAREWLAAAAPGDRDYPPARLELARIRARQGERAGAAAALGQALAANPALRAQALADELLRPLVADVPAQSR